MLPPLRALARAHQLGFVHRDIKPANILIGADRQTRLADFGLARIIVEQEMMSIVRSFADGSSVLAAGAGLAGTALYMAPELRRGDVNASDREALK